MKSPGEPYAVIGQLVALLVLATVVRLAVLPDATTDGSDSVARVWASWRWLSDPHWITHGVWGPLHSYPPGLGVAAVVLMYHFTRSEFGGRRAAFLVALTFAVYPIAVRNSVSVRSEAPFVLFLLAVMMPIALVRKNLGGWVNTVAASFFMTLAGMLRYEAWLLIPLFMVMLWPTRGLGLARLRDRLAALYGGRARLDLATEPGGGFTATLVIPWTPD